MTDPLNRKTTTGYDAAGRVTTVTDPTGAVTTNAWNTVNDRTSRTDANSHTTAYTYDQLHRPATVTDPLGNKATYGYDPEGHPTTLTDARGLTSTTGYDTRGLPTGTSYSDTTPVITRTYDKAGRVASVTDQTGTRTLAYDNADRLLSITAPGGGTGFTYTYDTRGSLTSRQYPDARKLTYAYDAGGNRTQQSVDGATVVYAYDPAGELSTTTMPGTNGYTEARTYDNAGRLATIASTKGTTTLASWQLTCDAAGQPTKIDANRLGLGTGTQNYTYDQAGRLLSGCAAGTLTYTYDKVGNRLTQSDAFGTTTSTYDAADQLTTSSIGTATTTYAYDADGNTTSVKTPYRDQTIASGATLAPGAVVASNNARLIMQADGNLVLYQIDTDLAVWSSGTAGHPGAHATMQNDGNSVVLDTSGTLLWSTSTTGNTGAVAKVQDDGNFVLYDTTNKAIWSSKTYRDPLAIHATTYTYGAAGHPTTVVGKQTFTFTYDGDGNRVTTKANGTLSRTLAWDINNPLPQIAAETNGTGALIGDYTYDPLGLPQSQHNPSGTYYHHHDWLGSVTDVTNSTGAQQTRTAYDPYGRSGTATIATGAPTTPFGSTGQYNDPVIPGKQYLRAREYDTATGRFTSRDPLPTPATTPYGSAYFYVADQVEKHADELAQQVAVAGLGGLTKWLNKAEQSGIIGTLREQGPVGRLLYGARKGEGLPGKAGSELKGRPTVQELENLTDKHGVEFAVIYKLGPGPKGAGGTYYLYSGVLDKVHIPITADNILVYHTHPRGAAIPSPGDREALQRFIDVGSPMRSSKIIPSGHGGRVYQFDTEGIVMDPGGRTWDVVGTPRKG